MNALYTIYLDCCSLYLVSNLKFDCCIDRAPPTDVRAEQDGLDTVVVTWTPPPAPPAAGYHVQVTVGNTTIATANVLGMSYTISTSQIGVYSIRLISLHFPSEDTTPAEVTVRGKELPLQFFI